MRQHGGFGAPVLLAGLAVLLIASACGGDEDEAARTDPSGPQTLIIGAREDGYTTEGNEADVGQYPLNANIFEGLVRMDANYEVQPALATEWEFKPPNAWTFTLREGVQFHDGTPFDAEAVKYTFDRVAKTGGGTPGFGKDSTKIIDDYTVEITPVFENRRLIEQLVHPSYSIIAPDSNPGDEPIGTGPFKFVDYSEQEQIVVERNDQYWGEKPTLEKITFRFLPEPNARRLALEAGEVDLIVDVPREAVADLEAKGFAIVQSDVGAYDALYLNISGEKGYTLLQDPAVRHAIGYAIDRDALVEGLFEGLAGPEQTMIPSRLLGEQNAAEIDGYAYDPQQAEQLLEDAGWTEGADGVREKDGRRLELELINGFPSAQAHGAVPEFLQDQLGEVGIEVKIVKMPDTASYEERLASGEGDIWIEQGSQNDANPVFLPALLFWTEGLFGDIGYQPLFAPGGETDRLIIDALANPDSEETKALTAQAMSELVDEEAIVLPMAGIFRIDAMSEEVGGYEPQPSALQVRYDGAFLARD